MTRRQKDPLRPLTDEERHVLEQISRARSEPISHVDRARLVLAVADGANYTAAPRAVGRRSNDAVATLVSRFNHEGLAALVPRHGGGPLVRYGPAERERILVESRQIARGMGPTPGHSRPYNTRCASPQMACRP